MDMRGIILIGLVMLAFIALGVMSLIRVGLQKGFGRLTAVTFGLLLLSIIIALDNRLRLAAALVASATAVYLLVAPSRPDSPFRRGENRPSTSLLAAISLGGILLFAWVFTSHMWNDVTLTVRYEQPPLNLDGNAGVLGVTVDASRLGDSVRVDEVRSRGAGMLERDPTDDLDCRGCEAHYRLIIVDAFGNQEGWPIVLEARVEVPRILADSKSSTAVDFTVVDLDIQPMQLDFGDQMSTTVNAERPFTLIRGTVDVPAAAMATDGLSSWPAFWEMSNEILVGNPNGGRFTSGFIELPGPYDCVAAEPCRDSEIVVAVAPYLVEGTAAVEAMLAGSVQYLEAPHPSANTLIEVSLDEATSWAIERASGIIDQVPEGFEVDLLLDLPVSDITDDYGVVAWVSLREGGPDASETRLRPVTAFCSEGSCGARFYIGATDAGSVEWKAEFHIGFFDGPVPAAFASGDVVGEPYVYEVFDDEDY